MVKNFPVEKFNDTSWNFGDFDLIHSLTINNKQYEPLKNFGQAFIGDLTGMDKAFVVNKEIIKKFNLESELLLPYAYRGNENFQVSIMYT